MLCRSTGLCWCSADPVDAPGIGRLPRAIVIQFEVVGCVESVESQHATSPRHPSQKLSLIFTFSRSYHSGTSRTTPYT